MERLCGANYIRRSIGSWNEAREKSIDRQTENLDNFARDLATALVGDEAAVVTQGCLQHQNDLITAHSRFPVEAISLVEHYFVAFRMSRNRSAGCREENIDVANVRIFGHFIGGKDNGGMLAFAKRVSVDIPLLHGGSIGPDLGDHTHFGEFFT